MRIIFTTKQLAQNTSTAQKPLKHEPMPTLIIVRWTSPNTHSKMARTCTHYATEMNMHTQSSSPPCRFPKNGISWRGSCLPDEHQAFFSEGKIFRCPAYLATSFRENVCDQMGVFWIGRFGLFGIGMHPVCVCVSVCCVVVVFALILIKPEYNKSASVHTHHVGK